MSKIERLVSLFNSQQVTFRFPLIRRQISQICQRQGERTSRLNHLHELAVNLGVRCSENLMALDEIVERAFECCDVERALENKSAQHVVESISRDETIDKPESLLSKRHGRIFMARER